MNDNSTCSSCTTRNGDSIFAVDKNTLCISKFSVTERVYIEYPVPISTFSIIYTIFLTLKIYYNIKFAKVPFRNYYQLIWRSEFSCESFVAFLQLVWRQFGGVNKYISAQLNKKLKAKQTYFRGLNHKYVRKTGQFISSFLKFTKYIHIHVSILYYMLSLIRGIISDK